MDQETLAHWTYTAEDWRAFVDDQWRQGVRGTIRSAILFLLLSAGAGLLTGKWIPFLITLALTEWIPVFEYRGALHSRAALAQTPADSWVGESGFGYTHFVLGPRRVLLEGRKVLKIRLLRTRGGLAYLQVAHKGSGRRASVIPDMIPVPRGREEEAEGIAQRLRTVWASPKAQEKGSPLLKRRTRTGH